MVSLLLLLFAGTLTIASSHSPARAWDDPDRAYLTGGTSGTDVGRGVVLDSMGNIYVAAFAAASTDAMPFTIADSAPSTCALSPCPRQLILTKLRPSGDVLWLRSFQSITTIAQNFVFNDLIIDARNDLFVAGTFDADMVVDGATISATPGRVSSFISKLNSSGDVNWTTQVVADGDVSIEQLEVDSAGNIYVAGSAEGDVTVGALTIPKGTMDNLDGFLLRIDTRGNPDWGLRVGGAGEDTGLGVSHSDGGLYLTGLVTGSATVSPTSLPGGTTRSAVTALGTPLGDLDIFVAKFDTTGLIITGGWPIRFGGVGADKFTRVEASAATVAVAGEVTGNISIGARSFLASTSQQSDVFIAAFEPSGSLRWGSRLVGDSDGDDFPRDIVLTSSGSVITTGQYGSSNLWFTSRHDADSGSLSWRKYIGDAGNNIGQSLFVDPEGHIYATGRFSGGPVDPDDPSIDVATRGSSDVLVVRLTPDGALAPHPRVPTPAVASPTTPVWRASLDPNGGTCRDGGSMRKEPWTSVFVGHRYLPDSADCSRDGYAFTGWAAADDPTTAVDLPRLVDPSDGQRRLFLATNADLVAIWTPRATSPGPITDLTVFANFLCGPCTNAWLLFTLPTDATGYTVSVNDSSTVCAQSGTFFDLSLCEITGLTPGSVNFSVTPRNDERDGSAATIQVILRR